MTSDLRYAIGRFHTLGTPRPSLRERQDPSSGPQSLRRVPASLLAERPTSLRCVRFDVPARRNGLGECECRGKYRRAVLAGVAVSAEPKDGGDAYVGRRGRLHEGEGEGLEAAGTCVLVDELDGIRLYFDMYLRDAHKAY